MNHRPKVADAVAQPGLVRAEPASPIVGTTVPEPDHVTGPADSGGNVDGSQVPVAQPHQEA